jgi:hypothetical protein
MGFEDFFKLDQDVYEMKIHNLTKEALQQEHATIRMKCFTCDATIVLGIVNCAHTGGTSLLVSAIGFRRHVYNEKKKKIIEECMADENWKPLKLRKRDVLLAVGPAIIASTVVPGAEHLTGHLAGHGASLFTGQHTTETVNLAVHDTVPFMHGVESGIHDQVSAMGQGLAGHDVQLVPVDCVATETTDFCGNMADQAFASTVEIAATKKAASTISGLVFEKYASQEIDCRELHNDFEKMPLSGDVESTNGKTTSE